MEDNVKGLIVRIESYIPYVTATINSIAEVEGASHFKARAYQSVSFLNTILKEAQRLKE